MPEVIDNVKVGQFIKELLKENNMTQDALSQKLMISKSAVSQNLNGKSSFDIQNLMSIAKIFGMSLDDLLSCHIKEETDNNLSEYMRFALKDMSEIKRYKASDLQIREPDIYGKVLVDYLIEQDISELFLYLHENEIEFVNDYYHRAKDIYLKIIIYMLRNSFEGVIRYIQIFSKLNNGFDLTQSYNGLEVWRLLDQNKNYELLKEMINLVIEQEVIFMGIKRKRYVKAITKEIWIESIGTYKLNSVLDVYITEYAKIDDLLSFSSSMLLYDYNDGIRKFIEYFVKDDMSDHARSTYSFQKTMLIVIKHGNFKLFKDFVDMHIYESLTNVVVAIINDNRRTFYEYVLKLSENKIFERLDYKQIGYAAIKQSNISLLEIIKHNLNQQSLNYLLSEVIREDVELLYYLISLGAKFDFKYYNSNTMTNTNKIIDFLFKKEVK